MANLSGKSKAEQRQALKTSRKQAQSRQNLLMLFVGSGLILIAVAVFLALPGAQAEVEQAGSRVIPAPVNFPAPEVSLTDLSNQPVALSDYRGQVVLYNAWATWCPPCKEEMPTLEAYYQAHQAQGFVILAIADGDAPKEVAAFVKAYRLSFPVWADPSYVATTAFKINNLPTSFVIDREGTVRLHWTGAITRTALEKYVTPLLSE